MNKKEQFYTEVIHLVKKTAKPNWNQDQALPVIPHTYARACKIALILSDEFKLELPKIAPCEDGTVHLYWSLYDKTRLIIEVSKIMDFDVVLCRKDKNISGQCNEENIIGLLKPFCIIEEEEDEIE